MIPPLTSVYDMVALQASNGGTASVWRKQPLILLAAIITRWRYDEDVGIYYGILPFI